MKKKAIVWLIAGILLVMSAVVGYGVYRSLIFNHQKTVSSDTQTTSQKDEKSLIFHKEALGNVKKSSKNTLMIYMVGSDLESRSKAGTEDLTEMVESGINLENANVLVYTGGSKKWHNDLVTSEDNHVLCLTDNGFYSLYTEEVSSMGTSGSLAKFVNYAYENYPAESYALILWDHGNGPLIGYGKDMLFDNDSMTLSEMQTAMNQTPFGTGEKLAWVGFDACLMSSAELACVWDNYADYLVASQEVEPSFGWNYGMLEHYGSTNDTAFLTNLVDRYLNTCLEYYEERGYEHRDTTLACLDLSYASELEQGISRLFERASADVGANYNRLAQKRVSTRALGRASTGSEYDLIDLYDMTVQLEDIYPEEAKNLQNIIDKMVVKNGTNAQLTCGLSLYYPFYNKYHYENSWKDIYNGLGVFASYGAYLDSYQTHWLSDDNLDRYASSPVAERVNEEQDRSGALFGNYKANLSPAQEASYADAKFYILEREKGDLYSPVFSSERVAFADGVLYADFQGKAIYIKNDYGSRSLPTTIENDSVGNIGRYTLLSIAHPYTDFVPMQFQMNLDYDTQEVSLGAILSQTEEPGSRNLTGGKREEHQLKDWESYGFYQNQYRYLSRYDNGMVKPFSDWVLQGAFSYVPFPVRNGLQFSYEPLDGNSYYLIFEITDTQGNRYCSEPVEMSFEDFLAESSYEMSSVDYQWDQGERLLLYNQENVTVYLAKYLKKAVLNTETDCWGYRLEVENHNEFNVIVDLSHITFNQTNIDMGSLNVHVKAQSSGVSSFTSSESNLLNAAAGGITELTSLEGVFFVREGIHYGYLLPETQITVSMWGDGKLPQSPFTASGYKITGPYLGAMAEKQILYQNDALTVCLEGFGQNSSFSGIGLISVENRSDRAYSLMIDGISVNGATLGPYATVYTYPNRIAYLQFPGLSEVEENLITQIGSLSVHLGIYSGNDAGGMHDVPADSLWIPITLSQNGSSDLPGLGEQVIYEENGVRIFLEEYLLNGERHTWYLTAVNDGDSDILLSTSDSKKWSCDEKIGAHQRKRFPLEHIGFIYENPLTDEFDLVTFRIFDWYESKILWEAEEPVTLYAEKKQQVETINADWTSGERCVIFNTQRIELSVFKKTEKKNWIYFEEGNYYFGDSYEVEKYSFAVKNNNEYAVNVTFEQIEFNNHIGYGQKLYIHNLAPGEEESVLLNNLEKFAALGAFDTLESVAASVSVSHTDNRSVLFVDHQGIRVELSEEVTSDLKSSPEYQPLLVTPYLDAMAEKQVLFENDDAKVELICFGKTDALSSDLVLFYENLSDKPLEFQTKLAACNQITFAMTGGQKTVAPHTGMYAEIYIPHLEESVSSLEDLQLFLQITDKLNAAYEVSEISYWKTVELSEKGTADSFVLPEDLIWNSYGVQVYRLSVEPDEKGQPICRIAIINKNDFSVGVSSAFDYGNVTLGTNYVGPHQMIYQTISQEDLSLTGTSFANELRLKFELRDYYTSDKLYASEEPMVIPLDISSIELKN